MLTTTTVHGGIEVFSQPLAPAAKDVFTPAELDARIAAHAARVEREMAEIAARSTRAGRGGKGLPSLKPHWKTCRCAGCSRRLFGESMRDVPRLPSHTPHVAGRVADRPYCADCLRAVRRAG